jgi:hypothetical protein
MSKPPDFTRKLARTVMLKGRQLNSLHDARELVLDLFGSVNARSGALDHAIKLLLAATESGNADVGAATDALERVLRGRRLLRGDDGASSLPFAR